MKIKSVIHRGVSEDDKLPVLVRLLKPEYDRHEELDLFDMIMKLQKN